MKSLNKFRGIYNGPASTGKPWFSVKNQSDTETEIMIYDQIGKDWYSNDGVSAKDFDVALKAIGKDVKILVRINSPGGNVWDGMAIYNMLKSRRENVTVQVDGIAASIASVIALAGSKCVMPANSMMMIHEPSGMCAGDSEDMIKMADLLDKHADLIAGIYAEKSGKSVESFRSLMKVETWMNGDESKKLGLTDEVTEEVSLSAKFDLSGFRKTPETIRNLNNSAPVKGAGNPETANKSNAMDKLKNLLKKHGVAIPENATEEQLFALVEGLPIANKNTAPVITAVVDPANPEARIKGLETRLENLATANTEAKRIRITDEVEKLISNDQLPKGMKEKAITRCLADESILDEYRALPSRPPGAEPLNAMPNLEITGDSPQDVEKGILNLRAPINSMLKGNDVAGNVISNNAIRMAGIIAANMKKLGPILNANTIGADLKRIVLLQTALRDFRKRVIALRAFSTVFSNVPLGREGGTAEVAVPFYALNTTASKDYVEATGYEFDQSTAVTSRKVTINKRKYKPFNFYSQELNRQPFFNTQQNLALMTEQLGVDVFTDVLSVVTVANYGASVKVEIAEGFDSDDVIDIGGACDLIDWPEVGRSLILDTAYHTNLKKDPSLKRSDQSGSDQTLREGSTGRVDRFDIYHSPRIPANAENLKGMAVMPSAILVATAPIQPGPGVRQQLVSYELVVDPETGMAFEYRFWGNPDKDEEREVVEFNYGYAKGQEAALQRLSTP